MKRKELIERHSEEFSVPRVEGRSTLVKQKQWSPQVEAGFGNLEIADEAAQLKDEINKRGSKISDF